MLSGLKEFAGIFAPCLAPAVLLIALAALPPVTPLFIVVAVVVLSACLFGWSVWVVFADRSEAAAASLLATPAYLIRPRSLLTDTRDMWQLLRRKGGRLGVRFAVEGTAAHYAAPLLIAAALWAIAVYCLWLGGTWTIAAGQSLATEFAAMPDMQRQDMLIAFVAMPILGAVMVWLLVWAFKSAPGPDTKAQEERERQAAELLAKWPFLAKSANAFGHMVEVGRYFTKPMDRNDPADVQAMWDALHRSAWFERKRRGHDMEDRAGKPLPMIYDRENGWLVDEVTEQDGTVKTIYARDFHRFLSPQSATNPYTRATNKGASYVLGLSEKAYAKAAPDTFSESWLGRAVYWWYGEEKRLVSCQPPEHVDGLIPILSLKLHSVTAAAWGRKGAQQDRGSAEWEWPESWAAAAAASSPQANWLAALADRLRIYIEQATRRNMPPCLFEWSARDPEGPAVHGGETLGRCYSAGDGKPARIWINAKQSDRAAAITLLHELIHAALPYETAHGPEFVKVAAALGFLPPYTQGHEGTFRGDWIDWELKAVGPMPRQKTTA